MLPGSVLDHEKIRKLLDNIPIHDLIGYRVRTILELIYSSGVRASEILGLDIFDADMKTGVMIVMGKGKKQRIVPVGKLL